MQTQLAGTASDIYLELYEGIAPNTVSNFLGYINRQDYDNSFFHRKVGDFIVQGGGFTYVPEFDLDRLIPQFASSAPTGELGVRPIGEIYNIDVDGDGVADVDSLGNVIERVNDGLQVVPQGPVVPNEFNLSNLRGTIAMAKIIGDPDSATNQWFVNLGDNSANLDFNNGGFTVFGKLMGSGMDFFDAVNAMDALPLAINIHPEFGDLPVINYTAFTLVLEENIARVKSATEVLNIDTSNHDFGFVDLGNMAQQSITVTNRSNANIQICRIGDTELLAAPYSVSDDCLAGPIPPGNACTITINFQPTLTGDFQDSLDIAFKSSSIPNVTINVDGTSSSAVLPDIFVEPVHDFGDLKFGQEKAESIIIKNAGSDVLDFTSIVLGGTDAADYVGINNCGTSLAANESCSVSVIFRPLSIGDKNATLTFSSNDPDESVFVVDLLGTSSSDADNISDAEENGGVNAGDENNDGVKDAVQNNVVSLISSNDEYISLVVQDVFNITRAEIVNTLSICDLPPEFSFDHGLVSYKISTSAVAVNDLGTFVVGLFLPANDQPVSFYQYGPTPDNTVPHWYEFMFDGETGAEIFHNAVITAPDGSQLTRDFIRIWYADGKRGDGDLSKDGAVKVMGGPAALKVSSESASGAINIWLIPGFIALIFLMRRYYDFKCAINRK